MKQDKSNFQEKYFTDYYQGLTGNFEHKDVVRNRNWFYGWFDALQNWFDFRTGKHKKVLEIGCSIGAAAQLLSERGFDVIATDISSFAVKKASKIIHDVEFEKLDIETSKKYDKSFDLIYAFEVIEHLGQPDKALENMHRMLKKNGVVICSTPYPYGYVFSDLTHINVRHPIDWSRIFARAGFKNIKYKQVGFVPFFYRFSKYLHIKMPFGLPIRYVNSTIFIYAEK